MARTEDFFSTLQIDGSQPFNGMTPDKALLSATLDLDVEQMTEIEFVMDDPHYVYFNSFGANGPIGKDAVYADLKLRVASYSLGPGSTGNGGLTLRLRPRGVERSRAIRGALTRPNISPTQFVIDGARSAGMDRTITQDSPVRPSISRDVAGIDGNQQNERDDKNEWTTLQRLAAEEAFLCFERSNTLIFGSPQWLFDTQPEHIFSYGPGSPYKQNWMNERPEYTSSTTRDSSDEIQFTVPTDSAGIILPGQNAKFVGLPKFFKERLLITNVNYPLVGPGEMSITARSPWVIEKQKTPEQLAAEQAAANAAKGTGSSGGLNMGPRGTGNQDFYAREIIAAARERNLGPDGARNGIATALVESGLRMYANRAVPASLNFPHDAVGSDHDSVGLFQQRQAGWGTLEQRMNARASAGLFFNAMMKFNWRAMEPGAACQKVQVSAYPGRYSQRMGEAMGYVNRLGY